MEVQEGPAFGAALMAAVGTAALHTLEEACETCVRTCDPLPPNAEHRKRYDAMYPTWQNLYRSLKADFKQLADLG